VDSHVHFWDRGRLDYAWLADQGTALGRDFLPEDLATDLPSDAGLRPTGLVFVQADCGPDQSLAEVAWVDELARSGAPVVGIVAHASLERGAACEPELDRLLGGSALVCGVRRLLQDEPAEFVAMPALADGVRALGRHGLVMDLCVRQHQLGEVIELVDACPEVLFVLDHLGKPRITATDFEPWAAAVSRLASRPHVRCKLSGLLSEAATPRRTADGLRPWLEHAIDAFGPDRCMYGSDWPVLTSVGSYQQWLEIVLEIVGRLSVGERACVLGATALDTYDPVRRAARAKESLPWL
jgi:L-fuconolactonase